MAKVETLKPGDADGAAEKAETLALRGEGLIKVYGGRAVVDNVNVVVKPGEVVGFLGPNGAGKTTTFYMLVGLLKPDKGRIMFSGEDITTLPLYQRARRGISYLPQEPSVFRKLTVEQNLLAVLETLPLTEEERYARLQTLLDELGISKLAKSKAGVLSGGERRRVEITRALVLDPVLPMPRRAVCRNRSDHRRRDSARRVVSERARHRGADVGSQRARDAVDHRSRVHHSLGQDSVRRQAAGHRRQRRSAPGIPWRAIQAGEIAGVLIEIGQSDQ